MLRRTKAQDDNLLRTLQHAGEMLRGARERLTGSAAAATGVRAEAASVVQQLLGPDALILSQVDAATAVRLLGDAKRLALWVDALELEADAAEAAHDSAAAERLRPRARALEA